MENTNNFTRFGSANGPNSGPVGRELACSITPTMSGQEALERAGIDWTVVTRPLSSVYAASLLPIPSNADQTLISTRSDNGQIVGVNGSRYNVIQNDVLAEMGDAIQRVRPDACFVAGGDRNGGKQTFLQMSLSSGIDLGDGDRVERHVLLAKGHDGDALVGMGVMHRMWCMNQWTSLTKGKPRLVSIRHTASAHDQVQEAIRLLEATFAQFSEWDEALRRLVETPARISDYQQIICGDRPDDGRAAWEWRKRVDNLWNEYEQDFNANLVGTAAGVVMAAQGADEHASRCRNGGRDQQRVGRMLNGNYPMASRAMAAFTS